ncbi:MAG TPA: FecR domain-containing protein [Polyangiaceae bacterium]|jgi:transmembrane sensor
MNARREPLGKHLPPRLTRERLDRQWGAIADRLPPAENKRKVGLPLALAFAGVCAALALFFGVRRAGLVGGTNAPTAATLVDGTWLESAAAGPSPSVTLAEGSRVSLGARSRLRLTSTHADAVRLDLERGRVDVQATHVPGRTFVVAAHDVEVHVVGTRFSVEADGPVRVRVEEGRVHVREGAEERDVSAGEEWVAAPMPPPSASVPVDDLTFDDQDFSDAGPASPARPAGVSAKAQLDEAQRAMAQGHPRDAARLFEALRRDHPRDPRAALAAFELARLRLDSFGDAAGAESAFREAMRMAREPGLRDDAEAGRIEALDRLGAHDACVRARDSYLARRASGVHRAEVAARCGGT